MQEKIKGSDCAIKLNILGTYEAYCLATSFTLSHEVEMNPVRTEETGAGSWNKYRPKRQGYTISFDGLVLVTNDTGNATTFQMISQMTGYVETLFQLAFTGENGAEQSITGRAFINAMTLNISPTGFVNKNVSMIGSGMYTINNDLEIPIITIECTGAGTGQIDSIQLTDPATLDSWTFTGPVVVGTSETWVLDGVSGRPGPGTYHIEAVVTTSEATNTFSTDAPPTATTGVSSPGAVLNTAPWGNTVQFDFTSNRTITFNVGS